MYNEEQKIRFIEENAKLHSVKAEWTATFNRLSGFEEAKQKDISCFTVDEITETLNEIIGVHIGTFNNKFYFIKKYVDWCVKNNTPNVNAEILTMRREVTGHYDITSLQNPRDLQEFLNAVFEPEEEMRCTNIYRVYCWMAYAGMPKEDIVKIRNKDVSISNRKVSFGEESYEIYPESIPAFKNCVHLTKFYTRIWDKDVAQTRIDGDYILRGYKAVPTPHSMSNDIRKYSNIARQEGATVKKLNYTKIRASGFFYRCWLVEKAGLDINFMDLATEQLNERGTTIQEGKAGYKLVANTANKLKTEYNLWKKGYNL